MTVMNCSPPGGVSTRLTCFCVSFVNSARVAACTRTTCTFPVDLGVRRAGGHVAALLNCRFRMVNRIVGVRVWVSELHTLGDSVRCPTQVLAECVLDCRERRFCFCFSLKKNKLKKAALYCLEIQCVICRVIKND